MTCFGLIEGEYTSGYEIGLNNIEGRKGECEYQWVWFETYGGELTDDTECYFIHRYSQVNGKTYKGIKAGLRAENTIASRLGIDLYN